MLSVVTDAHLSRLQGCCGLYQLCKQVSTLKRYEAMVPWGIDVPRHTPVCRVSGLMLCLVPRLMYAPRAQVGVSGVGLHAMPGVAADAYPSGVRGCWGINQAFGSLVLRSGIGRRPLGGNGAQHGPVCRVQSLM